MAGQTPVLNIIESIKKIKPEIIVYLVTGIIDRDIEEKTLILGAKELLHKPITNKALEGKIKEAIGTSTTLTANGECNRTIG